MKNPTLRRRRNGTLVLRERASAGGIALFLLALVLVLAVSIALEFPFDVIDSSPLWRARMEFAPGGFSQFKPDKGRSELVPYASLRGLVVQGGDGWTKVFLEEASGKRLLLAEWMGERQADASAAVDAILGQAAKAGTVLSVYSAV